MEPKKMTSEVLNEMLRAVNTGRPLTTAEALALNRHIAAMESEHRALLAANAVLASTLRAYYEAERAEGQNGGPTFGEWQRVLTRVEEALSQPHPGAAILSEMEALRKRVKELERHSKDMRAECAEWEAKFNDAGAQLATARAAALEEAAIAAKRRLYELGLSASLCCEAAKSIRALATTPPPPVVPVAKVRLDEDAIVAAALRLGMGKVTRGQLLDFARVLASDLGLTLDGET